MGRGGDGAGLHQFSEGSKEAGLQLRVRCHEHILAVMRHQQQLQNISSVKIYLQQLKP